jgi:hypothetical protein
MLEMTNENFARLLRGLTIAVGNRRNRILLYQFLNVQVHATVPGSALLIQPVALAALAMISLAFRPKLAGWLTCVYESTP